MQVLTKLRSLILVGMTLAFSISVSAQSQSTMVTPEKTNKPEPASQGWHVDVAPYLWFAGINGTVGALDHEASVHVSASKVLSYFNFGLMSAVETRYNRIIIATAKSNQRFLIQFSVTTAADQAQEADPDVLTIIKGFIVAVR